MTTYTPQDKNSTTYASQDRSDVIAGGVLRGPLPFLWFINAANSVSTAFSPASKNSTSYTPQTKN